MSEKSFFIENPSEGKEQSYKQKLLAIINEAEERVRLVNPDQGFHAEIHQQKILSNKNETKAHEEIRKDICESFGVPFDSDHVYIFDKDMGEGIKKQRVERAFIVLINAVTREAFYGEGRISHVVLLNGIIGLASQKDSTFTSEDVFDGIESNPPRFLTFKGFLSNNNFSSFSESSKSMLKTPIFDADGNVVETPNEWFLTGHSLEGDYSTKN
ncbi:MAG: hypothetical protein WC629_00010 [Candidatus Paceibacterota bacterium]|jgi:hypothetical protein